jgi:hypothetical protein
MNQLDIIDQHLIIRETVGYEILNEVPIEDMPKVMEFLKIVYNYNRMKKVTGDNMVEKIHEVHKEIADREEEQLIERIVTNNDIVGLDGRNPMLRLDGVYYTLDPSFKKILTREVTRGGHWWWDALEPK